MVWGGTDSRLCGYDETTDECDYVGYLKSYAYLVLPPLGIGLLAFLAGVVSLIGLCCACCFRCSCFSRCCANSIVPKRKRTKRIIITVLLFVFVILMICSALVAIALESVVNVGALHFKDESTGTASDIITEVKDAITETESLPWTESSEDFEQVFDQAHTTLDQIQDIIDKIESNGTIAIATRFALEMFFFVLFLVAMVVGIITVCIQKKPLVVCYWVALVLVLLPIALILATAIFLDGASDDLCHEYDIEHENPGSSAISAGIIGCGSGQLASFREDVNNARDSVEQDLCDSFNETCSSTYIVCTHPCNISDINATVNGIYFQDCGDCEYNCSAAACRWLNAYECADSCSDPDYRDYANDMLNNSDIARQYVEILDTVFMPLVECQFVDRIAYATEDSLCKQIVLAGWSGIVVLVMGFCAAGSILSLKLLYNLLSRRPVDLNKSKRGKKPKEKVCPSSISMEMQEIRNKLPKALSWAPSTITAFVQQDEERKRLRGDPPLNDASSSGSGTSDDTENPQPKKLLEVTRSVVRSVSDGASELRGVLKKAISRDDQPRFVPLQGEDEEDENAPRKKTLPESPFFVHEGEMPDYDDTEDPSVLVTSSSASDNEQDADSKGKEEDEDQDEEDWSRNYG